MGRPKGSKNKPKIELSRNGNSAVITIKMEKQVEGTPINRNSHRGWINWGIRNDYPLQLSNLYYNSPTHKDCVDFAATAIVGDGIDYDKMALNGTDLVPNYQYDWDTLIENIALDYVLYGSFALQIIKNRDGKSYSFYHQPYANVRYGEKDEDGVITNYWICDDWTSIGLYKPYEIESFRFTEDETIKSGKPYLFVYETYNPDINYYPLPHYIAALKNIQTEIELCRYDLRSVLNNFSASGILTMNQVDDEDERKRIIDNIQALFTGSDNANSLIINFKNNDEDNAVEFVKIDKDAGNSVNLFDQVNERIVEKIVAGHRITNKALIGYEADSSMLGGEGNILNVAFNLYNKTVITKMRRNIINTINKALQMNGIDVSLALKPLTFNVQGVTEMVKRDIRVDEVNEEEISEKATDENQGSTL